MLRSVLSLAMPAVAAAASAMAQPSPIVIEERQAEADGATIGYLVAGSGPPVVFLHGWPTTSHMWRKVMALVAAEGRTVVAVDLPGIGRSAPPRDDDYSKAALANKIAALMRAIGHERYAVVGHDIGGMTAYALAAQHGGAVEKLVLSEFWMPGFGLEEGMDVAKGGTFHLGFHAQADLAEELTRGKVRYYLVRQAFGDTIPAEDIDFLVRSYEQPGRMRAGFELYATLLQDGQKFRDLARAPLTMPVLVVGGANSFPTALTTRGARAVARDVREVVVQGSSHWIAFQQPEIFAAAISTFLAK